MDLFLGDLCRKRLVQLSDNELSGEGLDIEPGSEMESIRQGDGIADPGIEAIVDLVVRVESDLITLINRVCRNCVNITGPHDELPVGDYAKEQENDDCSSVFYKVIF